MTSLDANRAADLGTQWAYALDVLRGLSRIQHIWALAHRSELKSLRRFADTSDIERNMIQHMSTDNSRMATYLRVGPLCQAAYAALKNGLVTADKIHREKGWNPAADIHLHRHLTRRDAMEELKQVSVGDVTPDDDDNLGLPMSGLRVELPDDVLRIWHTAERDIPAPRSEAGRDFVTQSSANPDLFEASGLSYDVVATVVKPNSLIITWTAQGLEILRYDLIRPVGVKNGKVVIDWRYPLLANYKTMPDIQYRRRDDDTRSGDVEDT